MVDLTSLVLPPGILDYFTVSSGKESIDSISIHLEELNNPPLEHTSGKVLSKGFYDEVKVQDFPLRGKAVFLYVKRRRWFDESSGKYVWRDWDLVAKGTRMTQEFASFLKALHRYTSGKL
jgi:hypothetical protein